MHDVRRNLQSLRVHTAIKFGTLEVRQRAVRWVRALAVLVLFPADLPHVDKYAGAVNNGTMALVTVVFTAQALSSTGADAAYHRAWRVWLTTMFVTVLVS